MRLLLTGVMNCRDENEHAGERPGGIIAATMAQHKINSQFNLRIDKQL